MSTAAPPGGHVWLILSHSNDVFYLEIPTRIIKTNCRRPVKYLRFLGWCIMGRSGAIKTDRAGVAMGDEDTLNDETIYYFVTNAADDAAALRYAVDPEVMKSRSSHSTSSTSMRTAQDRFKDSLIQRDVVCVFTNSSKLTCQGSHIIPFHKGDEWLDFVVQNRPTEGEDVSDLNSIHDIRNGLLLTGDLHHLMDHKHVAVIKTPNPVLQVDDIPPRHPLTLLHDGGQVQYPDGKRYTMQWFKEDRMEQRRFPNNADAAFRKDTQLPGPSPALLHYKYGVAAVYWWGKNASAYLGISNRPNLARPSPPIPAALGPERNLRSGHQLTPKYRRDPPAQGSGAPTGEGAQDQDMLDAEEIVLLLWSQNPAAIERRRRASEEQKRQEEERTSRLEQWRQGATTV
ncbi:hypothetical protein FB45DRAFT_905375 [Roridomyces roridus]|uniref:HNH nuclease domain-containing protein n=1 Tax=Roridomyces roridus TaxID=1738132 RepID=A0AAD7C5T3_9AGAR|nr:hypothetical protein FB45DRAFT_905375 [Roridomyces roridus]